MPDYGHDPLFGVFITPVNDPAHRVVDLAVVADRAGLDLATFQDHPYQPRFHDTWTLLSFVAARTERIRLSANVHNLPLRQPAVLARSAASLDLLSGGRIELGLGAGGFWDAIEAMGGPRRTPGEAVVALDEAIRIIRGIWAVEDRERFEVDGAHYRVAGAKRGPAPAHDIGIWIGAYGPRMLRLTGRLGDGWIPSLGYLRGGAADLAAMHRHIDDGAAAAGRDPRAVRRMLNIAGRFTPERDGRFTGSPDAWADDVVELAVGHGISGFILAADDAATIERFAAEVAPAARARIAAARGTTTR